MNQDHEDYQKRMAEILAGDSRYPEEAYEFIKLAVSYTVEQLKAKGQQEKRHISGVQLLVGIKELALRQFGPLTINVFREWGIRQTQDFGCLVFNLVNAELLGASEEDSPEDFADVYDFEETFVKPFLEEGEAPKELGKIL